MEQMGYRLNGDDFKHIEKSINTEKKLILIEASKLSEPFFDGIKRYVYELLLAAKSFQSSFQIDVLINGEIISIEEALALEGQEQSIKQNQLFILAKNSPELKTHCHCLGILKIRNPEASESSFRQNLSNISRS